MRRRTSLPILIGVGALTAACGTNVEFQGTSDGGGSTTEAAVGSGGSGASGGSVGATGGSVGSTGGGGSGGCGDALPLQVSGCVVLPSVPTDPESRLVDVSGTVTAITQGAPPALCGDSTQALLVPRWGSQLSSPINIEVTSANTTWILSLTTPGFEAASVSLNDQVTLKGFSEQGDGFGAPSGVIELFRNSELIAMVGENEAGSLQASEGAEECYSESDLCGSARHTMDVVHNNETASIGYGQSDVLSDGLMVTNDSMMHHYDTSGGCNFGAAVTYQVGAAIVTNP